MNPRFILLIALLLMLSPGVLGAYNGVLIGNQNQTTIVLGGGGFANVQGPYLYNTTTLFFNETLLNITILNLSSGAGAGGANMSYTNLFLLNQSNTAQGLTTFNDNVTLLANKTLQLNTAADRASQGQPLEIWATTQQGKAYIGFYSYDPITDQIRQTAWIGSHYNTSSQPIPHQHFAIELLDNVTGTPDINTHFEISYGANVTTPIVQFPDSWVRMKDNQRFQFGDTGMFNVTYLTSNGKLAITGPGTDIQTPTIDLQGADIWRVDDIIGNTGGVPLDLKANTALRLFPANQTTFAFQVTNNSAGDIVLNAVGTTNMRFEGDNVTMPQLYVLGEQTNLSGVIIRAPRAAGSTEAWIQTEGYDLRLNSTGSNARVIIGTNGIDYQYANGSRFAMPKVNGVITCNATSEGAIWWNVPQQVIQTCTGGIGTILNVSTSTTASITYGSQISGSADSLLDGGQYGLTLRNDNASAQTTFRLSSPNDGNVNSGLQLFVVGVNDTTLEGPFAQYPDSVLMLIDGSRQNRLAVSYGQNLTLNIGDGAGSFASTDQVVFSNTQTQLNVPLRVLGTTPISSTPGATHTAWSIITNQNGSKGGHYQQVIMTGDGQTAYGNYFLTHDGGGTVLTNRSIYSTQNEMYVGANGNSSNSVDAYGVFNYVGQTGTFSRVFGTTSIILNSANNSQSFGTYNLITCGSQGSTCVSQADLAYSYSSQFNKTLQGIATDVRPSNTGDSALGVSVQTNSTPLTNPTGDLVGVYINWSIPGTDANNKKYGLYVQHTTSDSAKAYFGDPVYFNGTGPGAIFNTQSNFNDVAVFNNLVGLYSTTYLFGSIQGIAGSSITMNDAVLSLVNSANTVPLLQMINTNRSSVAQYSFTSSGFPGGGQLNVYAGGSSAVGAYSQFNNRSVIQGNNPLDIAIENVGPQVTFRSDALTETTQVNITSTELVSRSPINISAGGSLKTAQKLYASNSTNSATDECNLVGGTCTIANTKVTATTHVFCMSQLNAGTPGALGISARNAGVNYTVTSTSGTDTSKVACVLVEVY